MKQTIKILSLLILMATNALFEGKCMAQNDEGGTRHQSISPKRGDEDWFKRQERMAYEVVLNYYRTLQTYAEKYPDYREIAVYKHFKDTVVDRNQVWNDLRVFQRLPIGSGLTSIKDYLITLGTLKEQMGAIHFRISFGKADILPTSTLGNQRPYIYIFTAYVKKSVKVGSQQEQFVDTITIENGKICKITTGHLASDPVKIKAGIMDFFSRELEAPVKKVQYLLWGSANRAFGFSGHTPIGLGNKLWLGLGVELGFPEGKDELARYLVVVNLPLSLRFRHFGVGAKLGTGYTCIHGTENIYGYKVSYKEYGFLLQVSPYVEFHAPFGLCIAVGYNFYPVSPAIPQEWLWGLGWCF